ncbi:TIGR04463 family radical SAM/SPASM RiPP maturase [Kineococcus sp. SYSU DK001]|uniref:TIGR04463 family radical SAM/SPASM RiPP maturase n=1 Tax=Kineococcus sp. SYSU DK001 TaxID=3383122 RepID=UPI003D7EEF8C
MRDLPTVKPSRYNVWVPLKDGRSLLHNTASGALLLLEAEDGGPVVEALQSDEVRLPQDVRRALLYGGFIVEERLDEVEELRLQFESRRVDPTRMVLTVAPTLACNFGCDYCFQGKDKPTGRMSKDVEAAIVPFLSSKLSTVRELHVAWYGGEPLMAMPTIESLSDELMTECANRGIQYDAMIVTNGYSLTARVAEALTSRRVRLAQVTLDGAADYHNRRRMLLSGRPTFQRIVDNMKAAIRETDLRIAVRINIDSRNQGEIFGLIDALVDEGLADNEQFSIYFAPVEAITEGCHGVSSMTMTKNSYASLETRLQVYAFERGLSRLSSPTRFRGLCGAVRSNGFVLTPSGDVHKCWDTVSMPAHRIGTVFDGPSDAVNRSPLAKRWLQWSPFDNETCRSCRILPYCAGSCAHKFINPSQTMGEAAVLPCPSWKYQLAERLLLLALNQRVITRADYDLEAAHIDPTHLCDEQPVPPPPGAGTSLLPLSRA